MLINPQSIPYELTNFTYPFPTHACKDYAPIAATHAHFHAHSSTSSSPPFPLKALASLRQEIGSQQSRPPVVQDKTLHDSLPPPPPPPVLTMPQASPYVLHGHSEVAPPIVVQTIVIDDAHARMDRIKQRMRQLRVSDGSVVWDDLEGMSIANLSAKFRMPDIEKYMGIGCPHIHLRLYSTVMRAHGLDKSQMITLFPLSLSGAAQRWRDLKALRQRTDESVSSFISPWRGKIVEIIDRPSERDRIQMVLRSLQPKIARHVVGVPFTNFGSLVLALYDVEDGISRGLWTDSSPSDVKWKKPFGGQRSVDVSAISSTNQRPSRRHLPVPQLLETHPSYVPHQYRSRAPHPTYDQTYIPQTLVLPYYAAQDIERPPVSYTATGQPCYATQFVARPTSSHPRPRAQQASAPFALRTQRQFS
ncbi:hypothetical protein VitviT2T_003703 [Vitis vinifera]|uniref:Uncharacterized protein n=1 Tax=Vitis vinifera TaxID=29760 RepID=A0ABY9BMD8_VITVI|nr:hypothetical protein VitviT2T_003703 [Vitis vinifera]